MEATMKQLLQAIDPLPRYASNLGGDGTPALRPTCTEMRARLVAVFAAASGRVPNDPRPIARRGSLELLRHLRQSARFERARLLRH
jgi:hypothetical protein